MREKLRQTIENLFRNAPRTQSAQELKEEMLQNLLDKYDDLIAEGKSEEAAYDAAVAGIGDVNSLLSTLQQQPKSAASAQPVAKPEEPKQKNPVLLAIAIVLYVLCVVPNIIFGNVTGVVLMFIMIAVATAMILFNRTVVHPMRSALVGTGVALLILCPTPTMIITNVIGISLLFVMIAAGVGLIVYGRTTQFDTAPAADETGTTKSGATKYGYAAVAAIAILLLVGAAVSDGRRHTQVVWHGVTGEVIEGMNGSADTYYEEDFGDRIEDAIDESIDGNLDQSIDDAVDDAVIAPGAGKQKHENDDNDDDHDDRNKKQNAVAAAAVIMEGAAEIPIAGITQIEIDWVGGSVNVAPYNGDTIAISETSAKTLTERQKLRYSVRGNKLSISFCEDTLRVWDWLDLERISMPAKALTLQLPAGLALPELEINGVSADIAVNAIAADEIDVESVSGDIMVTDASGRKLSMQTTSGESTVRGADVTKLDLESTSGRIDATNSQADEIDVETVSADASLQLNRAPSKLDIETVSGKTTLTLPKDAADFALQAETVSGNVNCGIPSTLQNGRYIVGTGAAKYEFSSVSGDLNIVAG